MSLWQKMKQTFRSFMGGRYGADQLGKTLLWTGLVCYLLGSFSALRFMMLIGLAAYACSIFRIFSRNRTKRYEENRKYLTWKNKIQTKRKQAQARFRNRKQFKYFKCPGCKAWLKLPRGTGVATITCGRCKNNFTQKG